jgi:MFS family permease
MALPFLVLYLTRAKDFSPKEAGAVLTIYGLSALITAPLSGWLADRAGSLRVMIFSLFLTGLTLILFPFAGSPVAIGAMTALWSMISESYRPASLSLISELVSPENRKAAFSLNRLAINLGMSVGPALGGVLFLISFPALFWVNGMATIAAGTILAAGAGKLRARLRERGDEETHVFPEPRPAGASGKAFRDRRLLYFLFAILPVFVVFFQHEAALPLFLVHDLRLPESVYGLVFTVNTVLIVILEVPLNLATSRIPHRIMLPIGSLLVGLGFGAMAIATGFWSILGTVVIWTFGEMILLPSASTYMADIAPAERRGEYMGLYQMTFSLAFAMSASSGTAVLEHFGGATLWMGTLVAGVVSAILLSRTRPEGT